LAKEKPQASSAKATFHKIAEKKCGGKPLGKMENPKWQHWP